MNKGGFIGLLISLALAAGCYSLLGSGAMMCGPGAGFLLSPLILVVAIVTAMYLLKNKSAQIRTGAGVVFAAASLCLLLYILVFFL